MRQKPDSHDTANLNLAEGSESECPDAAIDDTADLTDALIVDDAERSADSIAEGYSEGIIRFYRARTILGRGGDNWREAWSYLKVLEPKHVPPVARPPFFSLAYLMHEMAHSDEFDAGEFCRQVTAIAVIIDGFLDDLESESS